MGILAGARGLPGLVVIGIVDEDTQHATHAYFPPESAAQFAQDIFDAVEQAGAEMDAALDELEDHANEDAK